MVRIPTVRIRKGEGFVIINEADYDPSVHELYDEAPAESPAEDEAPADEPEDEDASVDLAGTRLADLPAALAAIEDLETLDAAAAADSRAGAGPIYAARRAELTEE